MNGTSDCKQEKEDSKVKYLTKLTFPSLQSFLCYVTETFEKEMKPLKIRTDRQPHARTGMLISYKNTGTKGRLKTVIRVVNKNERYYQIITKRVNVGDRVWLEFFGDNPVGYSGGGMPSKVLKLIKALNENHNLNKEQMLRVLQHTHRGLRDGVVTICGVKL